jgi:HTH-type transcriptional regulator, transcriptional repressor of NAD biosynthesis genes
MNMKRYKNGLILGKFYPFHRGHEYLIREGLKICEHLTILVCSLQRETILGEIRFGWVKETFPECKVIHVRDENPQYPEEHLDFWNIWKTTIQNAHPEKIDVIFTSEDYGEPLANVLGCKHIAIDKKREIISISGTDVRKNPLQNWKFLPKLVQPFFVKKIVITGAESVGKTTLTEKLARHFGTLWVPEYGRVYLEEQNKKVEYEDIALIAKGHLALEDQCIDNAKQFLFIDTDLIITKLYSQIYFNKIPEFVLENIDIRKYDHHIVLTPDVPWVEDPCRDLPHFRENFHSMLVEELNNYNCKFTVIQGDFEERFEKAKTLIEKILDLSAIL